MTCRPTLTLHLHEGAGRGFLLTSLPTMALLVAGCSSSSSPASGAKDAAADTHVVKHADAGDAEGSTQTSDAGADGSAGNRGDAAADATGDGSTSTNDAHVSGEAGEASAPHDGGTPTDATSDVQDSPDATTDALADAHAPLDAHAATDAPVDSGYDAGPPALRFIGRTLTDGTSVDGNGICSATSPCYEWSGTQVVARFSGATAVDFMMSDYGSYFDVYVDGTLQAGSPIIGSGGTTTYSVATGLSAGATHEVSLYKRTEASSNGRTIIQGVTFPNGGTLLPPAAPAARRIEVIGDSISCGYGVLGPNATCTETSAYEDHDDTYGAITARNLGADLYTIASSGRGVYENSDGTMTGTLPDIYGFTVPYVGGGVTPAAWNFASWTPDAVVINLGTNDFFGSGGDPGQPFVTAYLAFVKTVRQNYPAAYIVCTNGPMLSGTQYTTAQGYIQSVVATMNAANDKNVAYLAFPTQLASNGEGCDGHPSVTTHQLMGTQLTSALKTALAW